MPNEEVARIAQLANYSDLFERMLDFAVLLDFDTLQVVDANNVAERLTGLSRQELQGKSPFDWVEMPRDELMRVFRITKRRYHPREICRYWKFSEQCRIFMRSSLGVLKLANDQYVIQMLAKDMTVEHEAEELKKKYVLQLEELNRQLEALSATDDLTKIANIRSFRSRVDMEHRLAERYGSCYSIVFCDVDNFKHFNDTNGHLAGDDLLRTLAGLLASKCRNVDLVARYGGEEFVVFCPRTGRDGAKVIAERLRVAVESHAFPYGNRQPMGKLTISVGVASYPDDGSDPEKVLKAADDALYCSKESGRNRVTIAQTAIKISE